MSENMKSFGADFGANLRADLSTDSNLDAINSNLDSSLVSAPKQKIFFKTFGCRSNFFDTQIMKTALEKTHGIYEVVNDEKKADVIVVNSCSVTNGADAGVQNYLNKFVHKKIFFTGCGVDTKGKAAFEKNQIFSAFPHSQKEKIAEFIGKNVRVFNAETNFAHIDSTLITDFGKTLEGEGKNRAFIKIQEGCNFSCSYCIIPSVRGIARSIAESQIIEQVKILSQNGILEVVLTGTNVGSYGNDTQTDIADLIEKIAQIEGIKRIRIGSLEPSQISQKFIDVLSIPKVECHLHIALQHTSNFMLNIMNRKNRFESDYALLHRLSQMGFALGTDFIVAHPGESESIWQEALKNLETLPLTHIHPFIYSPRAGTKSATMKQEIRGDIAKNRLHQIQNLIKQNNFIFRQNHKNTPLFVLIEQEKNGIYNGLDQFFNRVEIESKNTLKGIVKLENYAVLKEKNYGKI